ncbi:LCP family protein [Lentibacillus amyloliquefaciens]|uniref:Polyisoprenyl-teichoic acid--peptidoglycan teichoic acid transferase TagU n=1 Tax=Lentibacillus amyloliquefaciens TaxID=1472767 RepID=A0A0U4EBG6_9BACI|nr:LCP family protein [Lentibacillus amyloliquefaciens]ALX50337.1 transcriptional regulator LytR [Lentibacillus amyloliquefaciens]
MKSRLEKNHSGKKRKWPYWVGGFLLLLLIIVGIGLIYIYDKVSDTAETMHEPLDRDNNPERQQEINEAFDEQKSLNILLLGVDERTNDDGRSDTMILLSVNPNVKTIKMLSIPRDTRVRIPGEGEDKINHAYAFGGVELSIQTVEEMLGLSVHFYAKVNMEGFHQGIDALGGVTLSNERAFSQGGYDFPTGEIHLNGDEALSYTRMRKGDPRGDIGRNERQRNVIQAAINEAASFSSVTKVTNILDIIGDNVKTDLDFEQMRTLFTDYRQARESIDSMELSGSGQYIGDIWYYIVPDEEINRAQNELRNHMEAR